jgi:hypothetical protein
LPVSFAASGSCTVSGSSVHITGAGSCTITASQPGNANYNAATNVSRSFPIRCRVPNVVGKKLPAAKAAILRRGCRTGNVRRAYSRKVGKGRVSSQNLRAGRVVPARTKVNLVVSRGRRR